MHNNMVLIHISISEIVIFRMTPGKYYQIKYKSSTKALQFLNIHSKPMVNVFEKQYIMDFKNLSKIEMG